MPNWRRAHIAGGTFFFTLVTDGRAPILCEAVARSILRECLRRCQSQWPFEIKAIVLLPDHLHTLWGMPQGDEGYSQRWAWIKKEFTKAWLQSGGKEHLQTEGRLQDGRRGVWQPKFWEHTIQNEDDYERHFDYIHYNPVKHGLVVQPADWPWSSFHRWVRAGVYSEHWASNDVDLQERMNSKQLANTAGE